jgi:hypothetical protein
MRNGWWMVVCAVIASGSALAQSPCDQVPESMRARCEEAEKVKKACSGLKGEARKTCQQRNVEYRNLKEDCGKLAGDAKAACLRDSAVLDKVGPCSGKTGAELDACVKARAVNIR